MGRDRLLDYRREVDSVLRRYGRIIEDVNDWWLFASKFERMKQKSSPSSSSRSKGEHALKGQLRGNLNFTPENEQFYDELIKRTRRMLPEEVHTFLETALLAYLNFKKSQTEEQLKKMKESQESLPIFQFKEEIINTIKNERVVIIAGDTGCGKSTQVPQYLLQAGISRIVCTQPRRIACISLCKRVSVETQNKFGDLIGYQVRFERQIKDNTKIIFVTDGILLRQVSNDGSLSRYDVVILDEVHERHLQGDFLIGILKCLLYQRKDFKLVLMSATININLFTDYFGGNAKLLKVPGRLFPIKVHYHPPVIEEFEKGKKDCLPGPYIKILQLIDDKYPCTERGDVLIFVGGINEITTIANAAEEYNLKSKKWIVLPLHSALSLADQDKVFDYAPEGFRKCIISTNIAETSITIDGVRFVIDSGMMKEMSYDPVLKMQRLKDFWVSKASAEQRKGRAGRTGPGVCFRLYSESDFVALEEYNTPEIQRVPLDSVLLQMIFMGLPDVRKFPFLEPPNSDLIENSITSLKQHGAIYEDEKLTPMGHLLSKLPIDICLGKVLINGSLFDQIEPALSLAAALSVQSPYTHYAFKNISMETARKSFESDHGDPITLLGALKEWLEVKQSSYSSHGGRQSSKQWSKARGFEESRFYEMVKLRSQFKILLEESGLLEQASKQEELSAAERVFQKGERKLLREMKRKCDDSDSSRKKKILKQGWEIENNQDEGPDLKDINFRLSTNSSNLNSLLNASTACSYKDLTMLKIILLCGLYPQVAIPDEFNNCKEVSQQLFHTKDKPFVFLHPQSVFGNNLKVLQLAENDIVYVPGHNSRNPASSEHQLLCYISLLETNKPYLVNTMRMPLAQSLLLVSNEIFTNSDLTVLICDSWIRLSFPSGELAEKLLIEISKLRNKWQELLKHKIDGGSCSSSDLSSGLIKVMSSKVVYSYKRLLPADLKNCFSNICENVSGPNPFLRSFEISRNSKYGGLQLTPYLVYNCLADQGTSAMYTCPVCDLISPLNSLERLQHQMNCSPNLFEESSSPCTPHSSKKKDNAKEYNCPECNETLYLTSIEILKHKKKHIESSA